MISQPPDCATMIDQVMAEIDESNFSNVLLSRLVPRQRIELHTDRSPFRVYVPITTNPDAMVLYDDAQFHLPVGFAYKVDTTRPHGAENFGKTDRIHLMFDVV